jgi:hypothetical protein
MQERFLNVSTEIARIAISIKVLALEKQIKVAQCCSLLLVQGMIGFNSHRV